MSYIRDTVLILKNEPYREHDAWVVMYGKTQGKMEAVARGARRWEAKHRGHLEPFSEVEVMIAKGAAFDKLAVAQLMRPRQRLRDDLARMTVAGAIFDLAEQLTRPGMHDASVFALLSAALDVLEAAPSLSPDRSRFLLAASNLKLMDALGYAPDFAQVPDATVGRLLAFMRREPLDQLLRLTAPVGLFRAASAAVEDALQHTPLSTEPHGAKTVAAYLF